MAGMLPGVEYARRRGLHLRGTSTGTRRSSFSLNTTVHQKYLSSGFTKRNILNQELHDKALGHIAREAKERLDGRLQIRRHNSDGSLKQSQNEKQREQQHKISGNVQRVVFSSNSNKKRFSWRKLRWKSSEQSDCVVCLEEFMTGDILVHLPCEHRFHWNCAQPWLETRPRCPCCRMTIFAE